MSLRARGYCYADGNGSVSWSITRLLPAINDHLTPTAVSSLSNPCSVCFRDGGAMSGEQRLEYRPDSCGIVRVIVRDCRTSGREMMMWRNRWWVERSWLIIDSCLVVGYWMYMYPPTLSWRTQIRLLQHTRTRTQGYLKSKETPSSYSPGLHWWLGLFKGF